MRALLKNAIVWDKKRKSVVLVSLLGRGIMDPDQVFVLAICRPWRSKQICPSSRLQIDPRGVSCALTILLNHELYHRLEQKPFNPIDVLLQKQIEFKRLSYLLCRGRDDFSSFTSLPMSIACFHSCRSECMLCVQGFSCSTFWFETQ